MARDFLNDYLFIKVGRVGSAYGNSAATAMTGMSTGIRRLTWESASQRGKLWGFSTYFNMTLLKHLKLLSSKERIVPCKCWWRPRILAQVRAGNTEGRAIGPSGHRAIGPWAWWLPFCQFVHIFFIIFCHILSTHVYSVFQILSHCIAMTNAGVQGVSLFALWA
jgi:hypothetical protein